MSNDALYEVWKKERVACPECKGTGTCTKTLYPIQGCLECGGGGYTEDYLDWCERRHYEVNWDSDGGRPVNPDPMAAAAMNDNDKE
jgi:hypothetical protein